MQRRPQWATPPPDPYPPKKEIVVAVISVRQPFGYDLARGLCVEEFARVGR